MEEKVLRHLTQSKVSWQFNASTAPLHGAFIRKHGKQLVQPLSQAAARESEGKEAGAQSAGVKPLSVGELRHFARNYCSSFGQLCTDFWTRGERTFVTLQSDIASSLRSTLQKRAEENSDSEDSFAAPFPLDSDDNSDEEYRDENLAIDSIANESNVCDLAGLQSFLATEGVCQATKAERPCLLSVVQTLQAQASAVSHFRARLSVAQQWLSAARTLPFEAQVRMNAHDAADGSWKIGRVVGIHSDPVSSHFPVFHTSELAEVAQQQSTASHVHPNAAWFDVLYDDGSVEIGVAREHIDSGHLDQRVRGASGKPIESHQPHASSPRLRRDWSFAFSPSSRPFQDSADTADTGSGAAQSRQIATLQIGDCVTVRFGFGQVLSGQQVRCQTDPDLHILRLAATVPRYARSLLRCTTSVADYLHSLGDDRLGLPFFEAHGDNHGTKRQGARRHATLVESAYDVFLVEPAWLDAATTDLGSSRTETHEGGNVIDNSDTDNDQPFIDKRGISPLARRHFWHFKYWRACPSASSPFEADRTFCARLASDTWRATRIARGAALHLCEPCAARLKLLERLAARDRRSFAMDICEVYLHAEFSLSVAGRKVAQQQRKQRVDVVQQFLDENQGLLQQNNSPTSTHRKRHGNEFSTVDNGRTTSSIGTSTLDLARVVSSRILRIAEHKRNAPEL